MRTALLALALLASTAHATTTLESLRRPDGLRQYWLVQPDKPAGKRPLVIVLHGHGASGRIALGISKTFVDPAAAWMTVAARENWIVVAPEGVKGSDDKQAWNDCRADATTNAPTDDVAFIAALIDEAVAEHHADPERVYVTGASNGGGMAYRLAIELPGKLAAVAVSSALMATHSRCAAPARAMPMLIMHGTDDKISPYAGGEVGHWLLHGRGSGQPIESTVKLWRELARLPAAPVATAIPPRDAGDATRATRYVWGADPAGMQVEFLKIEHGGHVQPSLTLKISWLLGTILGKQNTDLEFAEETWAFFKDKRRLEPK
jgi:polyhydroxybutyrate depolymerase